MEECQESTILLVTTTVPTLADARRLAQGLVGQRLAACVQLDSPLTSFYRWQGRVCEDAEVRLLAKTVPERAEALQAWLAAQHPYELPQVVAVRATATHAYAQWVRAEVQADG
jgi:periplasmic divalent cation tolerance protein